MKTNPIDKVLASSKKILNLQRIRDTRKPGAMPGTLVHVGEKRVDEVTFRVIDYHPDGVADAKSTTLEECLEFDDKSTPTWIQVCGLHDTDAIGRLLNAYDIHPLIQEDVLNTRHRPKIEDFKDYIFIAIKELVQNGDKIEIQHLSIILTDRVVMTFQEGPTGAFAPIAERLKHGKGRIRNSGPCYLTWAILDTVIDHYRVAADKFLDEIDLIDDEIENCEDDFAGERLHNLKRQIDHLYRAIRPTRELTANLIRLQTPLIDKSTDIYLSDLQDHAQHANESAEIVRESIISLREYHLSVLSQRMNEVMKVLTSFATIFLPLTFLAGVYGMNFANMPELSWKWSYPLLWALFGLAGVVMFVFFRKKKWI